VRTSVMANVAAEAGEKNSIYGLTAVVDSEVGLNARRESFAAFGREFLSGERDNFALERAQKICPIRQQILGSTRGTRWKGVSAALDATTPASCRGLSGGGF